MSETGCLLAGACVLCGMNHQFATTKSKKGSERICGHCNYIFKSAKKSLKFVVEFAYSLKLTRNLDFYFVKCLLHFVF